MFHCKSNIFDLIRKFAVLTVLQRLNVLLLLLRQFIELVNGLHLRFDVFVYGELYRGKTRTNRRSGRSEGHSQPDYSLKSSRNFAEIAVKRSRNPVDCHHRRNSRFCHFADGCKRGCG